MSTFDDDVMETRYRSTASSVAITAEYVSGISFETVPDAEDDSTFTKFGRKIGVLSCYCEARKDKRFRSAIAAKAKMPDYRMLPILKAYMKRSEAEEASKNKWCDCPAGMELMRP